MIEKTERLLENKPNIITEASFSWNNNFCSVDILKNDSDGVEIYEVKSSTNLEKHPIYRDDIAYQYFVLSNLGFNVKKACLVLINNEYVRGKELDINQLFKIIDLTDIARQKQDEIRNNIDEINRFMEAHDKDREPETDIGIHCFNPYPCVFWDYCTRNLPKPNVFDIANMDIGKKFEKYEDGIISFEDLEKDDSITSDRFKEQIDFELHDRQPKINKEAIKKFLSSLKYPLYFIDYESTMYAIPKFEGTKPYQQIPFQYSLHIIKKEGAPLEHKGFLGEIHDENIIRNFAENMIKDLSEDGSVIVYNKTFEAGLVNKKLAERYPDLKNEIERINGNMVDLMVPFRSRYYHTKEMEGSYSIKKVLPALFPNNPELDYSNLSLVHHGGEALDAFATLNDKSPEEQEEIRKALLRYCSLDTLAMVKIWERFKVATED